MLRPVLRLPVRLPRSRLSCLPLLAVLLLPMGHAAAQSLPPAVVGALRVAHIPQQNTGVLVIDTEGSKRVLVSNNIGQPFNPASVDRKSVV